MTDTKKPSALRQLVNIISQSVDQIEAEFDGANASYPSVDDPFNPVSPGEGLAMSPAVLQAAMLTVSACDQLSATLKIPALTLYDYVGGFHISSCIRTAVESNVVEILREAGPQGLHCKDIAAKNGLDPVLISRVLRLLSTHHIFREVSPDVFTNNRLSSMMDTLKPVDQILAKPEDKHVGTPGMAALVEHSTDEVFKGSAIMTDVLFEQAKSPTEGPSEVPMLVAFKSSKPSFEWYEEPGNEARLKRYAAAMEGSARFDPPTAILMGFDWSSLPTSSLIVDVGGGTGSIVLKIAQSEATKTKNLKFVVQDRPLVVDQAKDFWQRNLPSAVEDGTVKLQAHDFFTPQPVTDASVFILRMILHDYNHKKATVILKHLRAAAQKDTKLLVVDQVVPYACHDDAAHAVGGDIPGAQQPVPPAPLLANLGKANAIAYLGDFQMYVGCNGEERTLGSFVALMKECGWKIERVYPIPGSMHKQVLATPI